MTIQENVPLAPLTTLQVGGPARYFAEAASENDVQEAVAFAKAQRRQQLSRGLCILPGQLARRRGGRINAERHYHEPRRA